MTRALTFAVALLATVGAAAAQVRDVAPRPTGTAMLAGRVLHGDAPVARAAIAIDTGENRGQRITVSDDEGRFAFDRLPAGRFLLTASKPGWVVSYYGSARPGRPPGVRIAVGDGARVNVNVPMVPGGVIAGRIVNDQGQPMARQYPWLLEYRTVGDQRLLVRARWPDMVGSFERSTDDRGEFRLFGLPPGTYYLVVTPTIAAGARITTSDEVRWAMQPPDAARAPPPAPGVVAGYAPTYFPGTPNPAAAEPIVVGPGEVRDGLTFRAGFVPVARVAGVVRRPDGAPAAGATLALGERESIASLEGGGRRATADAQGRFTFQNVPPGDYRLTARAATAPATAKPAAAAAAVPTVLDLWGQTDVVVSGADLEGLGVSLGPASSIAGRVVFDRLALDPPADLATIRLQVVAADALIAAITGAGAGSALHTAVVGADGAFRVEGLPPGRYGVGASWPGMRKGETGWFLTSVTVEGRDVGDAPLDVPANAEVRDVAVVFRDRIGAIEGVLTDPAGRPAPEYFVVAFPVERSSWSPLSRRAVPPVRPGTDGRFRLNGLIAGEYYLAVVTAVSQGETTDPSFLEAILPGAIRIRVADGETARRDLRIGG